ncbi:MAG: hypothetical protein AAF726_08280 [Planctomycetota bacterium]
MRDEADRGRGRGALGGALLALVVAACGPADDAGGVDPGEGPSVTPVPDSTPASDAPTSPTLQPTDVVADEIDAGEVPSLGELEAAMERIPSELEVVVDESLRQPSDPADWPPAATVGGDPVRIVRETHPVSGALMRIACARPDAGEAPVLHGPEWRYHATGFPRSVQWWMDDVLHGPMRQWRPAGVIAREGHFANGQRDGLWREYAKNGQLIERSVYRAGTLVGTRETWFPSGQSQELEAYRDGRLHGERRVWGRDGLLILNENWLDGERHGRWQDFHPGDGDPREWGTYENGERVGLWQRASPTGVVLAAVEYRGNLPHGTARTWSEDGVLIEELVNVEGERTGPSQTWYADGSPQSSGRLENGRRDGRWTYWKEDGSINERWSGVYEEDLRVAPLEDAADGD